MEKLISLLRSLGFTEAELSNRLITPQEDINELTALGNCNVLVTILGFKPGDVRDTHTHDEIRLTLVRSGKMGLTLEGKTIEVGAGGFVSTHPHVPHKLEVIGDEPLRIIELVIQPLLEA